MYTMYGTIHIKIYKIAHIYGPTFICKRNRKEKRFFGRKKQDDRDNVVYSMSLMESKRGKILHGKKM